jgi:hypothetical protein
MRSPFMANQFNFIERVLPKAMDGRGRPIDANLFLQAEHRFVYEFDRDVSSIAPFDDAASTRLCLSLRVSKSSRSSVTDWPAFARTKAFQAEPPVRPRKIVEAFCIYAAGGRHVLYIIHVVSVL